MRLLITAIAVSAVTTFAGRADAVGRMPGHALQFLGWGYSAGYHAPIVHAHPPVRRAIRHSPGGHLRHRNLFGPSRIHSHASGCCPNCPSLDHGQVETAPYSFEVIPEGAGEPVPQTLPPAPRLHGEPGSATPPAPNAAEGEAIPVPEASLPRRIRRG